MKTDPAVCSDAVLSHFAAWGMRAAPAAMYLVA